MENGHFQVLALYSASYFQGFGPQIIGACAWEMTFFFKLKSGFFNV